MAISVSHLRIAEYGAHLLAFLAVGGMCISYSGQSLPFVVFSAVISVASLATVGRRPITLFLSFGMLTSICFWEMIWQVRLLKAGLYGVSPLIVTVAVLFLESGAYLCLKRPNLKAIIVVSVAAGILLSLSLVSYMKRVELAENLEISSKDIAISLVTTSTFMLLGLLYAAVGVGVVLLKPKNNKKKNVARKTRDIVIPTAE